MYRITTHIKQLLLLNDHVIIPDIGLFKLQAQRSSHVRDKHLFYPQKKHLRFQSSPLLADDLLMRSYMQRDHLSEQEAQAALQKDLHEMERRLNKQGAILLDELGILKKEDDSLIFYPDQRSTFYNADTFGLASFHLSAIGEKEMQAAHESTIILTPTFVDEPVATTIEETPLLEEESSITPPPAPARAPINITATATEPHPDTTSVELVVATPPKRRRKKRESSDRTLYLPVNRAFLRMVAMVVILFALFLLLSTPVSDVSRSAYTASFIPSELFGDEQQPTTLEIAAPSPSEETMIEDTISVNPTEQTRVTPSEEVAEQETKSPTVAEPLPLEENKQQTIPVEEAEENRYYVIIASFETTQEAERFIKRIGSSTFKNIGIVHYNEYIRVYADKSDRRAEAAATMQSIRLQEQYKDAWLFVGR